MADARWIDQYDAECAEIVAAQAAAALRGPEPIMWSISHEATTWNPDGNKLSPYPTSGENTRID